MHSAALAALSLGLPESAGIAAPKHLPSTVPRTGSVDLRCTVSASRLDDLVAAAFHDFNHARTLQDFDRGNQGARYNVTLQRLVTTVTVPETGEVLKVSGLLAIPEGAKGILPVVSWQHGTLISFDQTPSNLLRLADPQYQTTDSGDSLETVFNLQRLAGQGYAVVAADYVGKGPFRNGRGEGYVVRGVTTETCIAVLDAGLSVMSQQGISPGPLFLNGWSQGALNTQWLHQELRRRGRAITATAVQSPFNDIVETWRYWAGAQQFPVPPGQRTYPALPAWISLAQIMVLGSYELHYGMTGLMHSAIRSDFHAFADKFWKDYSLNFDGTTPFPTGETLLIPGFFDRFTDDRNSEFVRQLHMNTSTYWRYDSPIRFYYGLADEALHPALVERALVAGGSKTDGIAVSQADHRGTFLAALYGNEQTLSGRDNLLSWFDQHRSPA
jgi:hypothetical protein